MPARMPRRGAWRRPLNPQDRPWIERITNDSAEGHDRKRMRSYAPPESCRPECEAGIELFRNPAPVSVNRA